MFFNFFTIDDRHGHLGRDRDRDDLKDRPADDGESYPLWLSYKINVKKPSTSNGLASLDCMGPVDISALADSHSLLQTVSFSFYWLASIRDLLFPNQNIAVPSVSKLLKPAPPRKSLNKQSN